MGEFRLFLSAPLLSLALGVFTPGASASGGFQQTVLNDDGAWCWFQDERAIISDEKLFVGSITSAGDVQVTRFDPKKNLSANDVLHAGFERDDHDSPALLGTKNGVMAFYSRHGTDNLMNHRSYANGVWSEERAYTGGLGKGFTYANPFQLSKESGRIYNFWRGAYWNPTYSYSDDGGESWSQGRRFILFPGARPYVKYASDGKDAVHFLFTEAHPEEFMIAGGFTSVYSAYYRKGKVFRSDGKSGRNLEDGITPAESSIVYDGKLNGRVSWVWDLSMKDAKSPVAVFSTIDPNTRVHRYHYARFDKHRWLVNEIAYAGSALYDQEPFYSGGISIDPDRPEVVYASANVDPVTGAGTGYGRYEIYRGETSDRGKTWKWEQLTYSQDVDNIRPIVPAGHRDIHDGKKFVIWMQGRYTSYVDYLTRVVLGRD